MNQDFDYFLLLTALAVVLVLWLALRTLRKGNGQFKSSTHQKSAEVQPKRIERMRPRVQKSDSVEKPKEVIKKPPINCIYFSTNDEVPFAVLKLTHIGAQSWKLYGDGLSENLTRFCDRFLKPQEDESLLIHIVGSFAPETALKAQVYTEAGECLKQASDVGLKCKDFPQYEAFDLEELRQWTAQEIKASYRNLFSECSAPEQAILIRYENSTIESFTKEDASSAFLEARAYLMLENILGQTNFDQSASLWNHYWLSIKSQNFPYTETLKRLERLVISQTFVQTQKLPFLLIQTPKGSGKCYNALNY